MTKRVRSVLVDVSAVRAEPRKESDRVFGSIPQSWAGYLADKVKAPAKAVGIEGMTFHTLRHWFTTNLVRRGVPLGDVAKLTGHKTLTMLLRYGGHSPQDSSRRAIAALDDASAAREDEPVYDAMGA
jgi:integrase